MIDSGWRVFTRTAVLHVTSAPEIVLFQEWMDWISGRLSAWPCWEWTRRSSTRSSHGSARFAAVASMQCPMNIDLLTLIRSARGMRERGKVPGVLHKGVQTCLKTGNNVGIPKEDFLFLLEDLAAELAENLPGFEVPVDKKGAKYLFTVNSKEPFAEPEDMMHWWRILYAANESWTVASENWEGVNWGLFTGDDAAMKGDRGEGGSELQEPRMRVPRLTRMRARILCDQAWSAKMVCPRKRQVPQHPRPLERVHRGRTHKDRPVQPSTTDHLS